MSAAEHLDREPALEILVPDLVHLGEPAAAEQPDDAVLAAEGAGKRMAPIGLAAAGRPPARGSGPSRARLPGPQRGQCVLPSGSGA